MSTKYRIQDRMDPTKTGIATDLGDGRYLIEIPGKEPREVTQSNFSRRYNNIGKVKEEKLATKIWKSLVGQEEPKQSEPSRRLTEHKLEMAATKVDKPEPEPEKQPEQEPEVDLQDDSEAEKQDDVQESEERSEPAEQEPTQEGNNDSDTQEEEQEEQATEPAANDTQGTQSSELDDLLKDAQTVPSSEPPKQEEPSTTSKPEPTPERTVEDIGLDIRLLDWKVSATTGGKTERVTSSLLINDYKMDITEYSGFITDVKLFEQNPDAPANDPDAVWKLVYKSPKMSLKDTLEWLQLSEDDVKIARKEITNIRKAVKQKHKDKEKERQELEEQYKAEAEAREKQQEQQEAQPEQDADAK